MDVRQPWGRVARRLLHHPRTALTLKAALAASLSLLVAQQIPGAAQDYSFYAPLGALVTMYPTTRRSVRTTLQSVVAIALGAAMALVLDHYLGASLLTVGLVVGIGVAVGAVAFLGEMRSYVPIAGLFTLVLGQGQEMEYAGAYAGLFLLGALVTLVVQTVVPTVPVHEAELALAELREVLAAHLLYLADQLGDGSEPSSAPAGPPVRQLADGARDAVRQAQDSFAGNVLAGRHREQVEEHAETFRALDRVGLLIEDLYDLAEDQPWGQDVLTLHAPLRAAVARCLHELAAVVPEVGLQDEELGPRGPADAAVNELHQALRRHEEHQGVDEQALVAAALATTLRRTLAQLTPHDRLSLSGLEGLTPDSPDSPDPETPRNPAD